MNSVVRAVAVGLPFAIYENSGEIVTLTVFRAVEFVEKYDFSSDSFFFDNSYVTFTAEKLKYLCKDFVATGDIFCLPCANLSYESILDIFSVISKCNFDKFIPFVTAGDSVDFYISRLLKEVELSPFVLSKKFVFSSIGDMKQWCSDNSLLFFSIEKLKLFLGPTYKMNCDVREISSSNLVLVGCDEVSEIHSEIIIYRDLISLKLHYAIIINKPNISESVLTRMHSSCYTGDLLLSLSCDCFYQLRVAIEFIAREGSGVLLYLSQEGRGIGLANKIRSYKLQQYKACDTVEANHALGFFSDERDFKVAANILKKIGIKSVRLITNNPFKSTDLLRYEINVSESIRLPFFKNKYNSDYIATKINKCGHIASE